MDISKFLGNISVGSRNTLKHLKEFNSFLYKCEDKERLVKEFLEATDCTELLRLLRKNKLRQEKFHYVTVENVFRALKIILCNMTLSLNSHQDVGMHITRTILGRHKKVLYEVLSTKPRIAALALSCLREMASLGGQAVHLVFDVMSSKHKCFEVILDNKPNRELYVDIILKLLTSNDSSIVDKLLSKTELLQKKIFPGLMSANSAVVLKVLKHLQSHVLESSSVNKTVRVQFFTQATTKSLMNLSKWKVQGFPKKTGAQNRNLKREAKVREVLHHFLVTLFTSDKYGILFRSKDFHGSCSNSDTCLRTIQSYFYKPWTSSQGRHLMGAIFASRPELLPGYLKLQEHLIFPRSSDAFAMMMEMLIEIMRHQEPWRWAQPSECGTVVTCLFPGTPLTPNFYSKLCQTANQTIRHLGCSLMYTILKKVEETIEKVKDLNLPVDIKEGIQNELLKKASITFDMQTLKLVTQNLKCVLESLSQDSLEQTEKSYHADLTPAIEIYIIVKFLHCYTEVFTSSFDEELLDPRDLLKMAQIMKDLKMEKLNLTTSVKKEFWTCFWNLLSRNLNKRSFDLKCPDIRENVFYILARGLSQYHNSCEFHLSLPNDLEDMRSHSLDCLLLILSKSGLSDDCEGLKYWLRYVSGQKSEKLSTFLTQVVQQTLNFYNQYTDHLVELQEKYGDVECSSLVTDHHNFTCNAGHESIVSGFNKPFSRFILAAVELLSVKPDAECSQYFSSVVYDYLHTLRNPEVLILFLIEMEAVLIDSLKEYIGSFFKHSDLGGKEMTELSSSSDLSELLKSLFMTRNWSSFDALLKSTELKKLVKTDPCLLVEQLLLYMEIEFKKGENEGLVTVEKYVDVLLNLYLCLEDQEKGTVVLKSVLEHPWVLSTFNPLCFSKCSISSLCHKFIEKVFIKHPDIRHCTYPYFLRCLAEMKSAPMQSDVMVDTWNFVELFAASENTVLNYNDLEKLLVIFMKSPGCLLKSSPVSLHRVLSLLLEATTAKKQPREDTVHLMFSKYLEWSSMKDKELILTSLKNILLLTLSTKVVKDVSHSDLKRLLLCTRLSSDICCKIVELHPQHGLYLALKLKEYGNLVPQAQLLVLLLQDEKSKPIAQEVLSKLQEPLKEWAMKVTDENSLYHELFQHSLKADMIGVESMVDICVRVYDKVTKEKVFPQNITFLLSLFEKVSDCELSKSNLPLGDSRLSLLHILMQIIKATFKKDNTNIALLTNCYSMLQDILPRVPGEVIQKSLRANKLWPSFVKQVLRVGLSDMKAGPQMIQSLDLLIDVLYRKNAEVETFEKENGLSLTTIFQMVISHTQYLELMFKREVQWDNLKESVVALQQTIIDHEESLCLENHIPVLLGAYGASMSAADQRILKLLYTYEAKGFMKRYQPVLWGDSAVTYFGAISCASKFKEPKAEQILSQLEKDKIIRTCHSFDINLPLEPQNVCGDNRSLYDMRFIIQLMLYLAEENVMDIDFAECGAVEVGITCLTSYHKDVWGAGATILKHVVDKMNKSSHLKFKLPWLWTITIVAGSLDGVHHRLPSVIAHFMIRATRLLSNPQDAMYFPIIRSLCIRPEVEMKRVPQFSRLFTSENLFESQIHLSFLLDLLATGIRYSEDYFISEETSTALLMMLLLQSPITDSKIKVQALEVLASMVRIPAGARGLVSKHNILAILTTVVGSYSLVSNKTEEKREFAHTESTSSIADDNEKRTSHIGNSLLIGKIVEILDALWSSMAAMKEKGISHVEHLDSGKRKRGEDSGVDTYSSNDEEESNTAKKFKQDASFISSKTNTVDASRTDAVLQVKSTELQANLREEQVHPLFVEEYLNCLLHLSSTVVKHAPPKYVALYLTRIEVTLKYVLRTHKLSGKETLLAVALDPHVLKERVHTSIPWEILYKDLRDGLTDAQEVRILGHKAEEYRKEWREESVHDQSNKQNQHIADEDQDNLDIFQDVRGCVFKLLDVLER